MHCADLDYSVFSIPLPFNILHAQIVERGDPPKLLDDAQTTVEYMAVTDVTSSISTTSQNGAVIKTGFRGVNPASRNTYVADLFGINPLPDEGLTGQRMPGFAMPYSANNPIRSITSTPLKNASLPTASPLFRLTMPAASPFLATDKRFAENPGRLFRNNVGHGGMACEACHGSTRAIWLNANPQANDNVIATQLQGHSGTITECVTCHLPWTLGRTLEGPHGMHPVNEASWTRDHEDIAESNRNQCRACHGTNGEGTELSRVAADREFATGESGTVFPAKGTRESCTLCHENEL